MAPLKPLKRRNKKMVSNVVYPNGSAEVIVSDKIAIFTEGTAKVYYKYDRTNMVPTFEYNSSVNAQEVVLTPGSNVGTVKIHAGPQKVYYSTGLEPTTSREVTSQIAVPANEGLSISTISVVRNDIADSGTVTAAQHRDQVLFQDASGGSVTMTSATAASINREMPNLEVGNAILQFHTSNHAVNTSTISGGTDVTLIGSGAVTNTGGQYLLVKTSATPTFALLRVG
jgi:hypothetical protein